MAITLTAGRLLFKVPIHPLQVDWLMFLAALVLGLLCLAAIGIILGSSTLTIRSEPHMLGEAVAAAMYLFSGAIFPITLLPGPLQPIGYLMPMTYWLELLRRALLGSNLMAFPTLVLYSNAELFGVLAVLTGSFGLIAWFAFRFFDRMARDRGMIDAQSNF